MAIAGFGQALNAIGQGIQQKAQLDWQEQRQANLDRIRAEERGEDRAFQKEQSDRSYGLQVKSQALLEKVQSHSMTNSDKSLQLQEENMRADNGSRGAQLALAREGLDLQKDNSEFSRVQNAYLGAMAGVANLSERMAEVEKLQPKLSADGTPLEDPKTFQDRKMQMLAELEDKLDAERAIASTKVAQLGEEFPQYQRYFVQSKKQTAAPSPPPLLQRATANTKYDPTKPLY